MFQKFKLSDFFGIDDDEDEVENNQSNVRGLRANPRKVVSMEKNEIPNSNIAIFEPRIYSDAKGIANKLMNGNATIVKFNNVSDELARRIIDFLNGTLYAIDGTMKRIDDRIFLAAPQNFDVDGAVDRQLKNNNME